MSEGIKKEPIPVKITELLQAWSRKGERAAFDALVPLVYDELKKQARRYLRRERGNHTLQTSALVHEAYIRLVEPRELEIQNRMHFFAVSATLMRQILVDHARTKNRMKRGGAAENLSLREEILPSSEQGDGIDILALDEALTRLAGTDAQQTKIVELRYFGGLTVEETAQVLQISPATVKRDWAMAKAWLHRELTRK